MKITQEADYALRMMCLLAREARALEAQASDGKGGAAEGSHLPIVGAATLAERVAVPTRFGLKILHKLAEAGLVKTHRGVAGGYSLVADPDTLTARQIIEAIDGPITLNRCVGESYDCRNNPDKSACRMHHVFEALNARVVERLDRLTLSLLTDDRVEIGDLMAIID